MNDAGNLAAFLFRLKSNYKKSYEEIVHTIQLIAPYFADFVLEPQEGNEEQIVLKRQQKCCEDIFNVSQLSDGTLRFICLATLLSVEMLNEFDVEDVIVVDRGEDGSEFKRLNEDELEVWLEEDYALGDLWKKNILGGRLSK